MLKHIYWIRHGWQGDELYNLDIPLKEEGRKQADLTGKRLKRYGIEVLFSSRLVRAVETAEIINSYLQVPHETREELREIDFGVFTGHDPVWARENYPEYFAGRKAEKEDIRYPGGENAGMLLKRLEPFLLELKERKEERIAVVTHGNVIRAFSAEVLGLEERFRFRLGADMENCGITEIDYDTRAGIYRLQSFNDTDHLADFPELRRGALKNPAGRHG